MLSSKQGRTWGRSEGLLGARVHRVNLPLVRVEGDASEGAHGVHEEQRAVRTAHVPDTRKALVHACRTTSDV